MTLRRVGVLLRHMPPDSAVRSVIGQSVWTGEMVLLADVFHALTGKAHPSRPTAPTESSDLDRRLLMQRARQRRRKAQATGRGA